MTYQEFIQNIIDTRGQWNIPDDTYFEVHHIIPLCKGGTGKIRKGRKIQKHENLIYLLPEEHYIAHKLLAEENPNDKALVYAWSMMAFPKGKTKRDNAISPEDYKILKELQSQVMKNNNNFLDENGHPKNYHVPMCEDQKKLLSEIKKGIKLGPNSEETKYKKSIAAKKRYKEHPETFAKPTLDKICITDGKINKYINKDEIIPEGFTHNQTRNSSNENYILSWTDERKLKQSKNNSGSGNPMYGQGHKLTGGKNGHAIYIYTFEGVDYQCRDDLMVYLKTIYPDISESTIRKIMSKKYTIRISKKYQYIIDNLTWKLKNEN